MNTIKALKVVWPNGIPTNDYDKLLSLIQTVNEAPPQQHYTDRHVSEHVTNAVLSHLAACGATCTELSKATKYSYSTVTIAISQLLTQGLIKCSNVRKRAKVYTLV
jgi:DNA-binding transcriptional ArsR family regulator